MPQKQNSRQPNHRSFFQTQASLACSAAFESALRTGLQEDGWDWDWTTIGTLKAPNQRVRAKLIAKSRGIWAGEAVVNALTKVEPKVLVKSLVTNGEEIKAGETLLEWDGPARLVLALERPFVNLASYIGGIATQTHRLVKVVQRACPERTPRVTPTRKTLPGYRDMAIYGVIAGGGYSHRVSLSGGVVIKENHIAAAGGVAQAVQGARAVAPHGILVEVEVRNMKELGTAIDVQAGAVLLDNFSPQDARAAIELIESSLHRPLVEISGGLNAETIADYAIPGVDVLSSGSITHSVTGLDLSLLVTHQH